MVEGEKFKLRNLPSRTSSLMCPAVNAGGTLLEFAALGSCPGDIYSRASAFCPQPWFLWWSEHIFPGITPTYLSIELQSINSWTSIKISTRLVDKTSVAAWSSHFPPVSEIQGSIPRGGGGSCLFLFFYYFKECVFSEINKYQQKKNVELHF